MLLEPNTSRSSVRGRLLWAINSTSKIFLLLPYKDLPNTSCYFRYTTGIYFYNIMCTSVAKDLLKDTKKANEDASAIEAALELMKHIPRETNNIICMSLVRGVHRSQLVGHGSLWLQDTLLLWSDKTHGGVKAEPHQVFLFDHCIVVALPANSDGFFDYQLDIKTLEGSLQEEVKAEPLRFSFTTADQSIFMFQAPSAASKKEWLSAITSILTSQSQMMKDLVFGKPATSKVRPSVSVDWEDSDSSVDSIHSSPCSSTGDPDWPTSPGYERLGRVHSPTDSFRGNSLTLPAITHSASFSTSHELSKPRSRSLAASLSPNLLSRFRRRSNTVRQQPTLVNMPTVPPQRKGGLRSPGSTPRSFDSLVSTGGLMMVRDEVQEEGKMLACAGQIAAAVDTSSSAEWSVQLLSGATAGQKVVLPRHSLESYNAPVSCQPLSETHSMNKILGKGRFCRVHKAKHKETGAHHAVKLLRPEVREEAFEHELCVVYHLHHPNIAHCFGGVASTSERALTFELVKGRTILQHMAHKPAVTDADVAELLRQMLDALAYLHTRTICHLDCRPDNIIVQVHRHVETLKLIDFGAARHFGCSRQTLPLEHSYESPAGYQFLPPEAFQQRPLSAAADMWAVGVITFIIFHGKYPFAGDSEAATIAKVMRGSYTLPNDGTCSQNVRSFIKAALNLDPGMRPSTAAATDCKWFKEDHTVPGAGPWQVKIALIRCFLSRTSS
jgi:hypothetical protein